jgi:hypothetical protein
LTQSALASAAKASDAFAGFATTQKVRSGSAEDAPPPPPLLAAPPPLEAPLPPWPPVPEVADVAPPAPGPLPDDDDDACDEHPKSTEASDPMASASTHEFRGKFFIPAALRKRRADVDPHKRRDSPSGG